MLRALLSGVWLFAICCAVRYWVGPIGPRNADRNVEKDWTIDKKVQVSA